MQVIVPATAAPRRIVSTIRKYSLEYADGKSPRDITKDFRPDVHRAIVFPTLGLIHAITDDEVTAFECVQSQSHWPMALADALIGLGFYKTTTSVPDELTKFIPGADPHYIVTKIPDSNESTFDLMQ